MFKKLLICALILAPTGCVMGPSGPDMIDTMVITCAGKSRFENYFQCVDSVWFNPPGSSPSRDMNAIYVMDYGKLLMSEVRRGKKSNERAILEWKNVARKIRIELNANEARRLREAGNSLHRTADLFSPPITCRTTYGQITSMTTCQ
jgi:hypothetical protein